MFRNPHVGGGGTPFLPRVTEDVPLELMEAAEMEAAGHPVIARIRSFGADRDRAAAYYDTADALGFLIEAVEPPARMPAPDFTI
jgi:hypothetical protein